MNARYFSGKGAVLIVAAFAGVAFAQEPVQQAAILNTGREDDRQATQP